MQACDSPIIFTFSSQNYNYFVKAIIVDDHKDTQENLESTINIYAPDIYISEIASGVDDGLSALSAHTPDLIFLSEKLPDGTGIDLLTRIDTDYPKVIFLTDRDSKLIDSFRFSQIDYLTKPLEPENLIMTVDKIRCYSQEDNTSRLNTLIHNHSAKEQKTKITLYDAQNTYIVALNEIVRCETKESHLCFVLADGKTITTSNSLSSYENLFSKSGFFKSHQDHLVNMQHFVRFSKLEGGYMLLSNGDKVPVAFLKRNSLKKHIQRIEAQKGAV